MIEEIRLSGSGGQGIILIGDILAEASGIYEEKSVAQNTAYGGQVRGGASKAEILIADAGEEIEYPEVIEADILLAMNQEALDGFGQEVKDRGVIIVDTSHVKKIPVTKGRVIPFPITDLAQQKFNNTLVANMVALGVLVGATQAVSVEAVERAIEKKAPEGTAELNKKAFRVGLETVRDTGVNPKEEAGGS